MYTIYPKVELTNNGMFIDIKSPWFIEKVADIRKDFYKSRIFDYPIFNFTPRLEFSQTINSFDHAYQQSNFGRPIYDHDRIKETSYCSSISAYDPISVYTALQYERLIYHSEMRQNESFFSKLSFLKSTSEEKLFSLIRKLLVQSYCVTYYCNDSLAPASLGTDSISQFMRGYIKEEHGHHRLIALSLKQLDKNLSLDELDFSLYAIKSMKTLKEVASLSTIALACALGFFEAASFQPTDPIADILSSSSRPRAAIGIKSHFDINKKGSHGLVGFKLATLIPSYISEHEVDFAISRMERIEYLSSTLIRDIFSEE